MVETGDLLPDLVESDGIPEIFVDPLQAGWATGHIIWLGTHLEFDAIPLVTLIVHGFSRWEWMDRKAEDPAPEIQAIRDVR